MKGSPLLAGLLVLIFSGLGHTQTLQKSIHQYSELVHSTYAENLKQVQLLKDALITFTATPSVMTQTLAKEAWIHAREAYDQTEAFRFYNGPIDRDGGPEGMLNSWPLDEVYIDYTVGAPNAGIIGNTQKFPEITKELLMRLNELDGEKNIATGYHAVEFLLWGQDFYVDGPGQRSYLDYVDAPNAQRRAQYLNILADLLVDQTASLELEWRPDQKNYRAEFEALKETAAFKKILSGAIFMSGDELSGERMYVAYDSQGQEDEPSCFSDMTHMDIQWDYWGVENVIKALELTSLPEIKDKPVAKRLEARMTNLRVLLTTIPAPFDQAIKDPHGREIILHSVEELEALAKDLVEVSVLLKAKVDY